MRITFVLPGIDLAGGIRSTFELANHLQERGHQVSVVYPLVSIRSGGKSYGARRLAGELLGIARKLKHGNSLGWFDLKAELIGVPMLAEKYIPRGDVIVATWWANAYDVNTYGTEKGKKFYFIRHYETWGGPEDLVNRSYSLPLHKIVTSTWLKNLIEEKFNVSVFGPVPNGVNLTLFYRSKGDFRCHNPKRIGMVYRREEWKGMQDGFKAFETAKQRYSDIKLVLFGTPKGEEVPSGVEFHTWLSGDRLREVYNSLDIFMFPSHYEGFGNPPMEAMACGVACVSTPVGAVPDYITDGKTGMLCPPRNPENLADSLIYLLDNEPIREQIAKTGHEHIQKFTWENSVTKLEEIFVRALLGE